MCFKTLGKIMTNPVEAVKDAKKKKDVSGTVLILMLSWLLIGLSLSLVSLNTYNLIVSISVGITIVIIGSLLSVFVGYLLTKIMNILGGSGKFIDGVIVISYSIFPITPAFLVTALLSMIDPAVGFIGFILMAVQIAQGFSIYFRATGDLFKTNMTKVLIGFLIMLYVLMLSMSLTLALTSGTTISLFDQMMSPLGLVQPL
ncbi:MAG: hypothetical protein JW700_03455 [Candidatus Aenigmarchaeota archaeon]|nr:hypothetical protein [Candidatus Aenigmarchaeota archaeon]